MCGVYAYGHSRSSQPPVSEVSIRRASSSTSGANEQWTSNKRARGTRFIHRSAFRASLGVGEENRQNRKRPTDKSRKRQTGESRKRRALRSESPPAPGSYAVAKTNATLHNTRLRNATAGGTQGRKIKRRNPLARQVYHGRARAHTVRHPHRGRPPRPGPPPTSTGVPVPIFRHVRDPFFRRGENATGAAAADPRATVEPVFRVYARRRRWSGARRAGRVGNACNRFRICPPPPVDGRFQLISRTVRAYRGSSRSSA